MSVVEREVREETEVLTEREQRARTLEAAALEIEVRGHAKYSLMWPGHDDSYGNVAGSVCLIGGIFCAKGWDGDHSRYPQGAMGFGAAIGTAVAFNNAPETTPADVTFLLRWRAEEIRDGWDA